MNKILKITLEAIGVFIVSFFLLLLIERHFLFYISWSGSYHYGELLDSVSLVLFLVSLGIFGLLGGARFMQKKVNFRCLYIIVLALSSPLSRLWIHRNLGLNEYSTFNGDYLKSKKGSTIGLLNKWGNTVVPCKFDFIYRFFDNSTGCECFASYKKEENSNYCNLYTYASGKQIKVDNSNSCIEGNVELFIQENYGTLLEKWTGDQNSSITQFSYLDDLRETRVKAAEAIFRAIEEFAKVVFIEEDVQYASYPPEFCGDSYEAGMKRERFDSYKRIFKHDMKEMEDKLEDAQKKYIEGNYESALNYAKAGSLRYYENGIKKSVRYVLGISIDEYLALKGYDVISEQSNSSNCGTRRVSREAIERAIDAVNTGRTTPLNKDEILRNTH